MRCLGYGMPWSHSFEPAHDLVWASHAMTALRPLTGLRLLLVRWADVGPQDKTALAAGPRCVLERKSLHALRPTSSLNHTSS